MFVVGRKQLIITVFAIALIMFGLTGSVASFGAIGPQSSDLVCRADRTISGYPTVMSSRGMPVLAH